MVPPSMPSRSREQVSRVSVALRHMQRCTTLVVAQKNLSVGQRDPALGDWASSRTSRPIRRMFRDLFGYIRSIQVNVALAQTE
jgi:hypothetical protein